MEKGAVRGDDATPEHAEGAAPADRRTRRSDPWKVAFVTLLIVAVLSVVTWLLLGSRLLVVRDVEVSGAGRLDPDAVEAAADVDTGTPLVRVDTDAATSRVEDLRLVDKATVSRGWPATLRVRVTERTPELSIAVGDGYRLVDHDGVRITDSAERPDEYPLVRVRGEIEGNPAIATVARSVGELSPAILDSVESIDASEPDNIAFELDDGATVLWGNGEYAERKAKALAVLMREHPSGAERRYDVSAPNVAVVK
ncbi:cell division protein FtsQ [Lipingzhangella halophila]|uniref:Cell division protein FtsQ n=1 Tax=Lipingzhangella halophila TaxID=1783352 RepID=A0A7W7RFK2_9ACTN|nr:FtsQ-type POTRA domain-containing protein [Lipingzhangella halophila]MBB4930950.1 cell division protein FtsQ [Lipingzhangella halophila]